MTAKTGTPQKTPNAGILFGFDPTNSNVTNAISINADGSLNVVASGTLSVGSGGAAASTGSTGTDRSANKPTIPNVGSNFGSTGVYANYVNVKTIAANSSRLNLEVENTSGSQIVIVRDDGTAAVGATPVNATAFSIGEGGTVGSQGGVWNTQTFKGRIQIYAPSTVSSPFISAFEDTPDAGSSVSTGTDRSANKPTIPNVGSNFGSTGIYANYALAKTIAANSTRANLEVENTSGSQIVIVRDDGTAASGSAPVNATAFAVGEGSSVGSQGGVWNTTTFKGRIQIYSPAAVSSPFISAYED